MFSIFPEDKSYPRLLFSICSAALFLSHLIAHHLILDTAALHDLLGKQGHSHTLFLCGRILRLLQIGIISLNAHYDIIDPFKQIFLLR